MGSRGLIEKGVGLINFLPRKGGTYQREGAYLRGGSLIEDLRYLLYLIHRPESLPVVVHFFPLPLWALV